MEIYPLLKRLVAYGHWHHHYTPVEVACFAGGAYVPTVFVGMYAPFGRYAHTISSMAKTAASFQK